ncbi:4Fe-4S binding protein [Desulfovibrio sp. OttesenSCG-928-A18]|nr:4Fe-4S binding protein [Desulfovibrio sp. OttesenSCG-928-A18]
MAKTIINNLLHKYSTRLHPVEQRILPDGFRGRFKFVIDKCILCKQCAIKCPTQVIHIDPEVGLWERQVMGCLYCGVCEDVCPTGCITMTNVYRPPITEPAFLRFNVKPRPAKKAKSGAGADVQENGAVLEAIEEKVLERDAAGLSPSKMKTVEEQAVQKADAEKQAAPAKETPAKKSMSVTLKPKSAADAGKKGGSAKKK